MTRLELITILVGQARSNGFEFRRWYTTRLALPWNGADAALSVLEAHRHYYALLFSHDFAASFWKPGTAMTFQVAPKSYERRMADGEIRTVKSAAYKRRTRPDAWRYHLREMALADEPLRYIRRYLNVEDNLNDPLEDTVNLKAAAEKQAPSVETPTDASPSPTLLLARKAHERRQLAKTIPPTASPVLSAKRGARLPGSRKPPHKRASRS